MRLTPDDRVLDLGCGTARVASLLADRVAEVVGVDYSTTALRVGSQRRPKANMKLIAGDLNDFDVTPFRATKAYAVGSLFYLNSFEIAVGLIADVVDNGGDFVGIDFPDEETPDPRQRHYNQSIYTHETFTKHALARRFPNAIFHRDLFPSYVNDPYRFSIVVPATDGNRAHEGDRRSAR